MAKDKRLRFYWERNKNYCTTLSENFHGIIARRRVGWWLVVRNKFLSFRCKKFVSVNWFQGEHKFSINFHSRSNDWWCRFERKMKTNSTESSIQLRSESLKFPQKADKISCWSLSPGKCVWSQSYHCCVWCVMFWTLLMESVTEPLL